jgi:hypothetical protein
MYLFITINFFVNGMVIRSGQSGYTSMDPFMDLELDNVLSLTSLKYHRDKYFHKDIGFSTWKELLNFVSS